MNSDAAEKEPGNPLPLPDKLQIAPWGSFVTNTGKEFVVDETTLRELPGWQKANGAEDIVLDFEHNSFFADMDPARGKDPLPVATGGSVEVVAGKGIFLLPRVDKWTPEGIHFYTHRHYQDVSPVLATSADGKTVIGVSSAALTRKGAVKGLHAFSATANQTQNMTEEEMNALKAQYEAFRKRLINELASLGVSVAETAKDEEILQALADWLKSRKEEEAAKGKETAPPSSGEQTALSAVASRIDALEADRDKAERAALVNAATAQGKLIPLSADAMSYLPVAELKKLLDGLASNVVPLSATAAPGQKATPQLTPEQKAFCARTGVKEEAYIQKLTEQE